MPCASFEELLIDYMDLPGSERARVDTHLAGCGDCREYLRILRQLEGALTAEFSGLTVSRNVESRVRSRIASKPWRLSFLPEILDFIGWTAIVTIVFSLAWVLVPKGTIASPNALPVAGASLALAAAAWIGVRAYAELK